MRSGGAALNYMAQRIIYFSAYSYPLTAYRKSACGRAAAFSTLSL